MKKKQLTLTSIIKQLEIQGKNNQRSYPTRLNYHQYQPRPVYHRK